MNLARRRRIIDANPDAAGLLDRIEEKLDTATAAGVLSKRMLAQLVFGAVADWLLRARAAAQAERALVPACRPAQPSPAVPS